MHVKKSTHPRCNWLSKNIQPLLELIFYIYTQIQLFFMKTAFL